MLIASFPTSAWESNCYLVARAEGEDALVIDPGPGAQVGIRRLVAETGVRVAGVVATHGHLDHVGDAGAVCGEFGVPLWLHPADRYMLADPAAGIAPGSDAMLAQLLGRQVEPVSVADVRDLPDDGDLSLAGIDVAVQVAPGHSAGSVLLTTSYAGHPDVDQLCFAGDVLFAGSIGRTDLASGDPAAMERTLRDVVGRMNPRTAVLPGHGPQTTVARELATNPYLPR